MKNRLFFIDVLRGIAACMVIFQHLFEIKSAWFHRFSSDYFQAGVFGVSLFFIISGFVITLSIEKASSVVGFWIKRFFRIYPLYLFCLASVVCLGFSNGEHFSVVKLLLNVLMINEPASMRIIGLSWTLTFEVIFYILITGLVLIKLQGKILQINCGLIILALLMAILKNSYAAVVLIYFINFFAGGICYLYYIKRLSPQVFYSFIVFLLISFVVVNYYGLAHVTDAAIGSRAFLPRTSANILALIVFCLALNLQMNKIMQNRVFLYLGEISYSLYLMQAIGLGLASNALVAFILTLIIATLTYHLIEKPFIRLGHKLAHNF